jgi:uncharacterized membrane protein
MITQAQGMFVFVVGLIVTLLGAGGVEHSITAQELTTGLVVAATGLGCMYCGTLMINRAAE